MRSIIFVLLEHTYVAIFKEKFKLASRHYGLLFSVEETCFSFYSQQISIKYKREKSEHIPMTVLRFSGTQRMTSAEVVCKRRHHINNEKMYFRRQLHTQFNVTLADKIYSTYSYTGFLNRQIKIYLKPRSVYLEQFLSYSGEAGDITEPHGGF